MPTHSKLLFALIVALGCDEVNPEKSLPKKDNPPVATETALTYENFAKTVIESECLGCHGPTPLGGAPASLDLSTYEDAASGASGVKTAIDQIEQRVLNNSMPPGGWDDEETREKFLEWLAAGAIKGESAGDQPDNETPHQPSPSPSPSPTPTVPIVAIEITNPDNLNEPATSDLFTIEVAVKNQANDATYELYYTSIANQTTGGQLIASKNATVTSIVWDTSAVADGAYYIYAILSSGGAQYKSASKGSVLVSPPPALNQNPSIALTGTFQTGAGALVRNAATALTYNASDPDNDSLSYALEYSGDSGATWTSATCSTANATGCQWDTSGLAEGVEYRVRVTVQDGKGGAATAASTQNFGIAASSYTYANFTQGVMTANCDGCHAAPGGSGGFTSDSEADVKAQADRIIVRAVDEQTMPSGGPALGLSDRVRLRLWQWLGAP